MCVDASGKKSALLSVFDVIDSYAKISGQTKQIFGRNTETETRPPRKAEISTETEISAESLFRQK